MSYKNTSVSGDLAVGHDFTAGGGMTLQGDATVRGDLRVEGWLTAPHVTTPCKGLFATQDTLEAAYPDPQDGWWAVVGGSVPGSVYRAADGKWEATGETGGGTEVDLTAKADKTEVARLETLIGQEQSARTDAVTELNAAMEAETKNRNQDDAGLQKNIDAEAEARKTAVANLQGDVDGKWSEAASAHEELLGKIGEEADARKKAVQELKDELMSYVNTCIQGKDKGSMAKHIPFKEISGNYQIWSEAINALDEYGRDDAGTNDLEYEGVYRFTVGGCLYSVEMRCTGLASENWVQYIMGNVALLDGGKSLCAALGFHILYRIHEKSGWKTWKDAIGENKE